MQDAACRGRRASNLIQRPRGRSPAEPTRRRPLNPQLPPPAEGLVLQMWPAARTSCSPSSTAIDIFIAPEAVALCGAEERRRVEGRTGCVQSRG